MAAYLSSDVELAISKIRMDNENEPDPLFRNDELVEHICNYVEANIDDLLEAIADE